jgi:hypothetical protein
VHAFNPPLCILLDLRFCDIVSTSPHLLLLSRVGLIPRVAPSSLVSTTYYLQAQRGIRADMFVALHPRPCSTLPVLSSYEVLLYKYPTICAMKGSGVHIDRSRSTPFSLCVPQTPEPCNAASCLSTDKLSTPCSSVLRCIWTLVRTHSPAKEHVH